MYDNTALLWGLEVREWTTLVVILVAALPAFIAIVRAHHHVVAITVLTFLACMIMWLVAYEYFWNRTPPAQDLSLLMIVSWMIALVWCALPVNRQ